MEYHQRVIIWFLWNGRINANQITDRLQAQFGKHADKLQIARFWIAEIGFGRQDLYDEICTGKDPLDDPDAKILAIFAKFPFKSAYSIAERLHVGHATVMKYLHVLIRFKSFHLRWVLHPLRDDLSQNEGAWKNYVAILACCRTW
jgi:hypothetical protein